jgi:hypothetical protein
MSYDLTFDLVDGWFDARNKPHAPTVHLADRLLNKLIYSISAPLPSIFASMAPPAVMSSVSGYQVLRRWILSCFPNAMTLMNAIIGKNLFQVKTADMVGGGEAWPQTLGESTVLIGCGNCNNL